MTSIYDFTARAADGSEAPLADYRGQVLLIVNTASKCGFTPQYEGLEAMWRRHRDQGFAVLGFPCNQFGKQEPGDAREIATFCKLGYDVSFPVLAKIDVNGPKASPLYEYLKREKRGFMGSTGVKWNFTKFLVSREGKVLGRYAPSVTPAGLEGDVVRALGVAV